VVLSHEMAETMTDPDLDGWYDDALAASGGEVGDVCGGHLGFAGVHLIQQEWSNAEKSCMAGRDIPLPPAGGVCPDGTHLQGADCVGNLIEWGCNSGSATAPALLGLLALALRRRRL
jgi:MYXO-CTERM domain-containing protein